MHVWTKYIQHTCRWKGPKSCSQKRIFSVRMSVSPKDFFGFDQSCRSQQTQCCWVVAYLFTSLCSSKITLRDSTRQGSNQISILWKPDWVFTTNNNFEVALEKRTLDKIYINVRQQQPSMSQFYDFDLNCWGPEILDLSYRSKYLLFEFHQPNKMKMIGLMITYFLPLQQKTWWWLLLATKWIILALKGKMKKTTKYIIMIISHMVINFL